MVLVGGRDAANCLKAMVSWMLAGWIGEHTSMMAGQRHISSGQLSVQDMEGALSSAAYRDYLSRLGE